MGSRREEGKRTPHSHRPRLGESHGEQSSVGAAPVRSQSAPKNMVAVGREMAVGLPERRPRSQHGRGMGIRVPSGL